MRRELYLPIAVALLALPACSDNVGPGDDGASCRPEVLQFADDPSQTGAVRDVHDPVIVREGDSYFLFSTGFGVPIRRSSNLLDWVAGGQVFAVMPAWTGARIPGVEFPWAPDVAFFNDSYHLYYSLSTFGSQRSAIGLATSPTLDPSSPGYGWTDRGPVVESRPGVDDFNAIDPNVAFDESAAPWLSWGSFWGGIFMRQLDPATGRLSETNQQVYALASRPVEDAVEAPFIVRRGGYFYLFISFDSCCRGTESTYNIRVGRSTSITGPYSDRAGRLLMQGGGTMVLEGYGRVRGPGHNAVLVEDDRYFLVHHFYDAEEGGVPKLQIRPMAWDESGWPLAGPPYDGRNAFDPDDGPTNVAGTWGYSVGEAVPYAIELEADNTISGCRLAGSWSTSGTQLTLAWTDSETGEALRRETAVVSSDGSWYAGRRDDGTLIQGVRVNGD